MKNVLIFLVMILASFFIVHPKVLIIVPSYNNAEFIKLQYRTFNKFLKDDFELVIFNDASNDTLREQITKTCNQLNIVCIRVPQEIHDRPYLERVSGERYHNHSPGVRNCNVVQYALDTLGFNHDNIVLLLDSDMFLVRDFSISNYLKNKDCAAWLRPCCGGRRYCEKNHPGQSEIKSMFIGLVFLDMRTLPNKHSINFNCGLINNVCVDAGGYTYYYLRDNPLAQGLFFDLANLGNLVCKDCWNRKAANCTHNTKFLKDKGLDEHQICLIESMPLYVPKGIPLHFQFFLNYTFLHYRGGTNYNNSPASFHAQKTKLMNQYFEKILN